MTCMVLVAGALLIMCPLPKPKPQPAHIAKQITEKEFRDRWLRLHFRERVS